MPPNNPNFISTLATSITGDDGSNDNDRLKDGTDTLNANLINDGTVDNTEFGYLNGVTSAIQTQIDNKATKGFAIAMAIAL